MRGKVWFAVCHFVCLGITPAYAGKSSALGNAVLGSKDHPRVCGEKLLISAYFRFKRGSPPRMRGKEQRCIRNELHKGITPAYAGKSSGCCYNCSVRRDHPRVCGEKSASSNLPKLILGSPPRMRGKALPVGQVPGRGGITPAYAGKSAQAVPAGGIGAGSPPRMRGKEKHLPVQASFFGITPAYAGKRQKFQLQACR